MSRMSSRFEQGAAAVSTSNMLFMLFLPHDVKKKIKYDAISFSDFFSIMKFYILE